MSSPGFKWRVHFERQIRPDYTAGYHKTIRAWTRRGAARKARLYRHRGWTIRVVGRVSL